MAEGGTAGRRKRGARRRVAAAARAREAAGRDARRFDDLWRELPIHSLLVFGLPGGLTGPPGGLITGEQNDATVTVFVTDRFRYSSAPLQAAAAFTVPPDILHDDAAVEALVARALSSLSWEGMRSQAEGVDHD
jgi:hypothetical protein